MVVICRVISDEKKRAECELKRNNSVVNDLDVGQREGERGAGLFQATMLTRTQTMDPIDPDAA